MNDVEKCSGGKSNVQVFKSSVHTTTGYIVVHLTVCSITFLFFM